MNTLSAPSRFFPPFPAATISTQTAAPPRVPAGLLCLGIPIHPESHESLWLFGENVLLASVNGCDFRYAGLAYVVTHHGSRALPVMGSRAWSQPPLGPSVGHPVWRDLAAGIVEAARQVADSGMDLQAAITCARSWLDRRHAQTGVHRG